MSSIEEYYKILGLPVGANADAVKKAFRTRIKTHHPDTAKTPEQSAHAHKIIEAYQALKDGPPRVQSAGPAAGVRSGPTGRGPFERPAGGRRAQAYDTSNARPDFDLGREAGKRIFEEVFGRSGAGLSPEEVLRRRKAGMGLDEEFFDVDPEYIRAFEARVQQEKAKRARQAQEARQGEAPPPNWDPTADEEFGGQRPVEHYWDALSEMVWGGDPDNDVYGENVDVKEYRPDRPPGRGNMGGALERATALMNRAEGLLKMTVQKYDVPANLKKKSWVREYLARLNDISVLFRDVANRHPIVSTQARERVRQIRELSFEIRRWLA